MHIRLPMILALAVSFCSLAAVAPVHAGSQLQVFSITKAPVAPDGTTAGRPADFVITVADRDPAILGIGIVTGGTIEVVLPPSFVINPSASNGAVPLQGWPQSPPGPPPGGNFTVSVNAVTNTITVTMNVDFLPGGIFGPGFKQLHLVLLDSVNPGPGLYPVKITVDSDGPAGPAMPMSGTGNVKIIPRARPSINTVSLFSGFPGPPPLINPIYQTVSLGTLPVPVGFYLWGKDSAAAVDVDLVMMSGTHGVLFNVMNNKAVGQVWIDAPAGGGSNYSFTTNGPTYLEPSAFVTGVPVGVLITQFTPDPNVTGDYVIKLRMNGGNTERLFVTVTP